MAPQRPWFYPGLGFLSYVKKYPFVFLFSFLSAAWWAIPFLFPKVFQYWNGPSGFSIFGDTLHFGILLFALLHQWLASPRLKNLKYRSVIFALGFGAVEAFYFYFDGNYFAGPSVQRLELFVTLAALLFPLTLREYSPEELWAFVVNGVQGLAAAFLVMLLAEGAARHLGFFFPQYQYSNFPQNAYFIACFLVLPWYLLGVLEKSFYAPEEKAAGKDLTGPGWVAGTLLALGAGYLFEFVKAFQGFFTARPVILNNVYDEREYFFGLAFYSMALAALLHLRKNRPWTALYPKILSLACLLLLAAMAFSPPNLHLSAGWIFWNYDFFSMMVWLAAVFLYFLLVQKPGWKRPVLSLLVLLSITSVGPLSQAQVAYRDRQNALKRDLTDSGLLKDGHFAKVSTEPDPKTQNRIYGEMRGIAGQYGLKGLRNWMPEELRGLNWDRENSPAQIPRLMDWLGLTQVKYFPQNRIDGKFLSYRVQGSGLTGDIAGYDWQQTFYFNRGSSPQQPGKKVSPYYVLELPDQSQTLLVECGGQTLAEIPLGPLAGRLVKYDYNDAVRNRVFPKDMVLEFSNNKVKVKLLFSAVNGFEEGKELQIQGGNGVLLVKPKRPLRSGPPRGTAD
jgi:hypothetical protein